MLLVSTTLPSYKMAGDHRYWSSWLANAEAVQDSVDEEVRYYAAVEVDGRGLEPFGPLLDRLGAVGGTWETFSYDDGCEVLNTANRLVRICTGQNFGTHHAMEHGASHVLFMAADAIAPDDALPRLLELAWPICGLNIPTYCLDGPDADPGAFGLDPAWDVRLHMQSAALLLVRRHLFSRLRWRIDNDAGMTDDPCYHHDALQLGFPTLVRHDTQAHHYPEAVGAMETRHTAVERAYHR